jgi:hypothetical protein
VLRKRAALGAEMLVLRQQIVVLRRGKPGRLPFSAVDKVLLGWVCHLFPKARGALAIVRPDTVVRWHRVGFRCYWRFKSRRRRGHPGMPAEIRQLIREMSIANPLWGAPRIHGELLKLGIDVGQTSVAKYMARRRGPPSQGWKTFLRNHADGIAAMDLFVVPTLSVRAFRLKVAASRVETACRRFEPFASEKETNGLGSSTPRLDDRSLTFSHRSFADASSKAEGENYGANCN